MKVAYLQICLCLDRLSGVDICQKMIQFSGVPKMMWGLFYGTTITNSDERCPTKTRCGACCVSKHIWRL